MNPRAPDLYRRNRFEAQRQRALELRRADPELPALVIAERVGAGRETVRKWLADAAFARRAG